MDCPTCHTELDYDDIRDMALALSRHDRLYLRASISSSLRSRIGLRKPLVKKAPRKHKTHLPEETHA